MAGLDHIPLAVNNLEHASAYFEKLGFVLKPGRYHNDGIRNAHIKFANHTEIELITAAVPTDPLAAEYVEFLKAGDGPAFWSLYSPDLTALTALLASQHLAPHDDGDTVTFSQSALPHRLFFADREPSPTDTPAYFRHPNTAYRLTGVWIADDAPEQHLVASFGTDEKVFPCTPAGRATQVVSFPEGDVVTFMAGLAKRPAERTIIGATVRVHNLAAARAVLLRNHVPFDTRHACGASSLWISPTSAHGLWLEFREG